MTDRTRLPFAEFSWATEHYDREIKLCTGSEGPFGTGPRPVEPHRVGPARVPRFEVHRKAVGGRWVEVKTAIIREVVRVYLPHPRISFPNHELVVRNT